MFSTEDSIVALATPEGRGGIGVIRISGRSSLGIAGAILDRSLPLQPRRATYARVRGRAVAGVVVDEAIATYFPAPRSYTGEDVVEISAHGSPVVLDAIVRSAIAAGARLAAPGEFTLRAFLNGKRDLIQAEAVADLVAAATPLQARVAFDQLQGTLTGRIREIDATLFDAIARLEASLDFPDEGYHFVEPSDVVRLVESVSLGIDQILAGASRGRTIREGATVVMVGRPNVGKSSIFNVLVGHDRAIVTSVAGTTRDLVSEKLDWDGLAVTLVDAAGYRETEDVIEREGVQRATRAWAVADLLLLVLDSSEPLSHEDEQLLSMTTEKPRVVLANKSDLPPAESAATSATGRAAVAVSATTGTGVHELRQAIVSALSGGEAVSDSPAVSNLRHIGLLKTARTHVMTAAAAAAARAPEEIVLSDLQAARALLDEIVGTRTAEDILEHIFERFCIGK